MAAEGCVSCHHLPWPPADEVLTLRRIRALLLLASGARCFYCGRVTTGGGIVEHRLPVRRGGRTTLANCVWACQSCNSRKGGRTVEEFAAGVGSSRWYARQRRLLEELDQRQGADAGAERMAPEAHPLREPLARRR